MQDYEWSIKELVETIHKTQKVDKDYVIVIDGQTGGGKSTLATKICIKGCLNFKIEEDIIFSRDEFIDKITNSPGGRFYPVDEAINVLFKRDFATKKQKFLIRLMDMCRDKNLCLILCVPNFWSIDKHILEGRVKLRIHVARTGLAFMWKPTGNPFTPDKWCRKYNEKVCSNWDSYPNAKRTKGFIGYLKFGDLADSYKERYLKIKEIKKALIAKQEAEEEKKKEVEKTKGIKTGEMQALLFLRENGLLKQGALTHYASKKDQTIHALSEQLKRYKKKFEDTGTELNEFNNKNIYNNSNKEVKLEDTPK